MPTTGVPLVHSSITTHPSPFPSSLTPGNHEPVLSVILSFPECSINGIIQHVIFEDVLFSLNVTLEKPSRLLCVSVAELRSVVGMDHSVSNHPAEGRLHHNKNSRHEH